jgi:hypothetical protein
MDYRMHAIGALKSTNPVPPAGLEPTLGGF